MLLCRVCLGEMYRIEDFDGAAERHVRGSDKYDSLLGDREATRGTFREFIVYDERQVTAASLVARRDKLARDMNTDPPGLGMHITLGHGPNRHPDFPQTLGNS